MGRGLLGKIASGRQVDGEKRGERKPFFLGVSVTATSGSLECNSRMDAASPNKLASPL